MSAATSMRWRGSLPALPIAAGYLRFEAAACQSADALCQSKDCDRMAAGDVEGAAVRRIRFQHQDKGARHVAHVDKVALLRAVFVDQRWEGAAGPAEEDR